MNLARNRNWNYGNPDSLTKEQLLMWAKENFMVWDCSNDNQSAWYILLLWAERE